MVSSGLGRANLDTKCLALDSFRSASLMTSFLSKCSASSFFSRPFSVSSSFRHLASARSCRPICCVTGSTRPQFSTADGKASSLACRLRLTQEADDLRLGKSLVHIQSSFVEELDSKLLRYSKLGDVESCVEAARRFADAFESIVRG